MLQTLLKQIAALRTPAARRLFLEMRQEAFRRRATELTEDLEDGDIALAAWVFAMKHEIKMLHGTAAAIGKGDWRAMTSSGWGRVGAQVKKQYGFLDGFVDAIVANDGKPWTFGFANRARSYAGAGGGVFWRFLVETEAEEKGYTEVKWNMTPREHCRDCRELASRGWMKPEKMTFRGDRVWPRSGGTRCLYNCGCYLSQR